MTESKKSYSVAVALTFFLGGLGIHKFYLGKPGIGILYFLFCWTFIPVIISLIDLITLLSGGQKSFDKNYNKEN